MKTKQCVENRNFYSIIPYLCPLKKRIFTSYCPVTRFFLIACFQFESPFLLKTFLRIFTPTTKAPKTTRERTTANQNARQLSYNNLYENQLQRTCTYSPYDFLRPKKRPNLFSYFHILRIFLYLLSDRQQEVATPFHLQFLNFFDYVRH